MFEEEIKPTIAHLVPNNQIGNITMEQKAALDSLLNEFKDIFTQGNSNLGTANGIFHKIDTKPMNHYFNTPTKDPLKLTESFKKK